MKRGVEHQVKVSCVRLLLLDTWSGPSTVVVARFPPQRCVAKLATRHLPKVPVTCISCQCHVCDDTIVIIGTAEVCYRWSCVRGSPYDRIWFFIHSFSTCMRDCLGSTGCQGQTVNASNTRTHMVTECTLVTILHTNLILKRGS